MATNKVKVARKVRQRRNPLATDEAAHLYVAAERSEAEALKLARGAGIGVAFAVGIRKVFDLETWLTSRRSQAWLKNAGGVGLAFPVEAFRSWSSEAGAPSVPSGGFAKDVADLVVLAQRLQVLSNNVFSRFQAEPRVRELVVACGNELNMLAVFAARAARDVRLPGPTATELAALAVWLHVEKGAQDMEERDRRIDKFRKILKTLPQIESILGQVAALP